MEKKEIVVKYIDNLMFAGKGASNHWTVVESEFEENNPAATGPMELVLIALGGCTGADVVSILRKKRVSLHTFSMRITGERAEEHPRVYKKIHIEYRFSGEALRKKDLEHAIELSATKYCSVSAMLSKTADITHNCLILDEAPVSES
jgi:putative redox protein